MSNALVFIVSTLFDLYLLTYALRLLLPRSRGASFNPLVQFVQRVTNPVILPLRRVVPAFGKIDTANVVALLLLQAVATFVVLRLTCGSLPGPGNLLLGVGFALLDLFLRVWFWSLLIYVVLSWVSPGRDNPAQTIVEAIVEPLLRPFRQILPPVAGFDLSPLFAAIALQAVRLVLQPEAGAHLCTVASIPVI